MIIGTDKFVLEMLTHYFRETAQSTLQLVTSFRSKVCSISLKLIIAYLRGKANFYGVINITKDLIQQHFSKYDKNESKIHIN